MFVGFGWEGSPFDNRFSSAFVMGNTAVVPIYAWCGGYEFAVEDVVMFKYDVIAWFVTFHRMAFSSVVVNYHMVTTVG